MSQFDVKELNGNPVKVDIVPKGNPEIRPAISMVPQYITVHNTGNAAYGANAEMHNRYIHNLASYDPKNTSHVSWHITTDDKQSIQHLPFNEMAWHCGDGANGTGNTKSIGIEICMNKDGDQAKAEANAIAVIVYLMKKYDIPAHRVVTHQSWSGKYCPAVILSSPGGYANFHNRVVKAYQESEKPQVTIKEYDQRVIGVVQSDVWQHNEPNFDASSRSKVMKKGQRWWTHGETADMYWLGEDEFVSKKYLELEKPKAMKATGKGTISNAVWTHNRPDFKVSTRVKVLQKGEQVTIYGESNGLYKIGANLYVSKKYVIPNVKPKAKTGVAKSDVWTHTRADYKASTRYKVLFGGQSVGVYGEVGSMYKVRLNGRTVYVAKSYINVK